jgi:hypothetical protein
VSPGFPTFTSTFTFFGLSWLEFADAFAFPVWSELPGGSLCPGALAELPGELLWPVAFALPLPLPLPVPFSFPCVFAVVVRGGAESGVGVTAGAAAEPVLGALAVFVVVWGGAASGAGALCVLGAVLVGLVVCGAAVSAGLVPVLGWESVVLGSGEAELPLSARASAGNRRNATLKRMQAARARSPRRTYRREEGAQRVGAPTLSAKRAPEHSPVNLWCSRKLSPLPLSPRKAQRENTPLRVEVLDVLRITTAT